MFVEQNPTLRMQTATCWVPAGFNLMGPWDLNDTLTNLFPVSNQTFRPDVTRISIFQTARVFAEEDEKQKRITSRKFLRIPYKTQPSHFKNI